MKKGEKEKNEKVEEKDKKIAIKFSTIFPHYFIREKVNIIYP